jgi:hypothetical protein
VGHDVGAIFVARHPRSLRGRWTGARPPPPGADGRYRTLRARTAATSLRYRGRRGSTLTFRVTATDAAGNRSRPRGSLRFRGTGVAVFLARGSRVRSLILVVDGHPHGISRGRTGLRHAAFARTGLRRGRHRLKLLAPRGTRLDAVAISR